MKFSLYFKSILLSFFVIISYVEKIENYKISRSREFPMYSNHKKIINNEDKGYEFNSIFNKNRNRIKDRYQDFRFPSLNKSYSKSTKFNLNNKNPTQYFILNTQNETYRKKSTGLDVEVFPTDASASSEFKNSSPLYSSIFQYAGYVIDSDDVKVSPNDKWCTGFNVKQAFIELNFPKITKLDSIVIIWGEIGKSYSTSPKKFKVSFKIRNGSKTYIPLTEDIVKFKNVNDNSSSEAPYSSVAHQNVLTFAEPIFVKSVKIDLIDPIINHSTSKLCIKLVKFYNRESDVIIYNQTAKQCKNLACIWLCIL